MSAEKSKKKITAPIIALLATAFVLVLAMAGTAQAALDKQSSEYETKIELSSLSVGLTENGQSREGDNTLLTDLLKQNGKKETDFAFGYYYKDDLAAKNLGATSEYVRISVNKYWLNEDGTKATDLNPGFIELDWADGWVMANGKKPASTVGQEQTVIYSTAPLDVSASKTFIKGLRISPDVLEKASVEKVNKEDEGEVYYVTTYYTYKDKKFAIDIEVASVQTHNASEASKSAWGVDVTKFNGVA